MRFIYFFIAVLSVGLIACSSDDIDPAVAAGVAVNRTAFTLVIGEYEVLSASVFPETALNRNVTWRSDDTEIATVDNNGRVTAVSTGATNIVVRSVDGNHIATSRVTVRATPVPPVAVTGVNLNRSTAFIIVGAANQGGRVALTATVLPNTATNSRVTWESSNPAVAVVNNIGQVDARGLGYTIITVTTEDGNRTATARVTVVDGAFIGGAIWARYNVGAVNEEDAGMLFQWNRRQGWAATGTVTGWDSSTPTGTEWRPVNSPCPAGWRLPTNAELNALGIGTWTTENGVTGRRFSAAGGNTIFLPAAGYRSTNGTLSSAGTHGFYWSSTQLAETYARGLGFDSSHTLSRVGNRAQGFSVRCVAAN